MSAEQKAKVRVDRDIKSDFARGAKCSQTQPFSPLDPAQNGASESARPEHSVFGAPMTIREVARMFGCSVWTVRQRYLPLGLPHFRLRPTGKILFFYNQVVRWLLAQQRQKGGIRP